MVRVLLVGLAWLAVAACGYRSDVDLAPMAERAQRAVVAPGDYCEATASNPPYLVKSSEDCERIAWDQTARVHLVKMDEEGEEPSRLAPVPMGDDLFLIQDDRGEERSEGRYEVTLALAKGAALFVLPPLDRDRFVALAAKHPDVTLRQAPDKDPIITGGERDAIRALLRAAAVEALQDANLEDDELSVAIRDRAGAPDHDANGKQTMDIIDLVTAIFALRAAD